MSTPTTSTGPEAAREPAPVGMLATTFLDSVFTTTTLPEPCDATKMFLLTGS